jgi:Ser/Thr protein kinase RdoA (MazF antagonist)
VADADGSPDPQAVLAAFGLQGPDTSWAPVGGAWSNRVFRLAAGGRAYAVKQMRNPWGFGRWQEWLAEAWSLELRAIDAGVAAPQPVPEPATGSCLARVRTVGEYGELVPVRVHRWVNGQPFGPGVVDEETARWVGRVVATLHGLVIEPGDRSLFPVLDTASATRWPDLTEAALRSGAEWAELMQGATSSASVIAELALAAGERPEKEVMSHGDIDQKNLLATASGPVLCDWDVAAPLVPRRELADVAMSMANWRAFDVAREVIRAYRSGGGDDTEIMPADLGQPMLVGLDWVTFNVERALGLRPASGDEVELATSLLPRLLGTIPAEVSAALRVTELLHL